MATSAENEPTIAAIRDAYGDAAAWSALARTHHRHRSLIVDLAAGRHTPSTDLPAAVACGAIALLHTAHDIDLFTYGDTRPSVAAAAQTRLDEIDEPRRRAAFTASVRNGTLTDRHFRLSDTNERVAIYLDAYSDPDNAADAIAHCAHTLTLDHDYAAPLPTDGSGTPIARAIIVAARALYIQDLSDIVGLGADDLRRASMLLRPARPDPGDTTPHLERVDTTPTIERLAARHGHSSATDAAVSAHNALAAAIWAHPDTTDDDLCTHWGISDLTDVTDDLLEPIVASWETRHHLDTDQVDAFLTAVTDNGNRHIGCAQAIPHSGATLPYRVAVALSYHHLAADELYVALTDGTRPHWTDDDIATHTPAGHPVRDRLCDAIISDADDASTTAITPAALLDDAMRNSRLGTWLTDTPDPHIAERLTTAAAAANFDIDAWGLLWDHYQSFRGTPEELIDMLDAVRPHSTTTPAAA